MSRFAGGPQGAVSPDTQAMLALLSDRENQRAQIREMQARRGEDARQADQQAGIQQQGVDVARQRMQQDESQFARAQGQQQEQFTQAQGQQAQQFQAGLTARAQENTLERQFHEKQQRDLMQFQASTMQSQWDRQDYIEELLLAREEAEGTARLQLEQQAQQEMNARANAMAKVAAAQAMMGRSEKDIRERVLPALDKAIGERKELVKKASKHGVGIGESAHSVLMSKLTEASAGSTAVGEMGAHGEADDVPGGRAAFAERDDALGSWYKTAGVLGSPFLGAPVKAKDDAQLANMAADLMVSSLAETLAFELKEGSGSPRELDALLRATVFGSGKAPGEGPLAGKESISSSEALDRLTEMGLDAHTLQAAFGTLHKMTVGPEAMSRVATRAAQAKAGEGMWRKVTGLESQDRVAIEGEKKFRAEFGKHLVRAQGAVRNRVIDVDALQRAADAVRQASHGGDELVTMQRLNELEQIAGKGSSTMQAADELAPLVQQHRFAREDMRQAAADAESRGGPMAEAMQKLAGSEAEMQGLAAYRQAQQRRAKPRAPQVP